jgi:predicted transcriptional regulator
MRMGCSYPLPLEVSPTSDLEDKLSRLASTQGRDATALVVEAVERLIEYDAWFIAQVDKGLAQVEAGRALSQEDVGRRVKARISAKLSAAGCSCDRPNALPPT